MNQIFPHVDAMLKDQGSILDSYNLTFGELDPDNLTVPVTLTITPKEYTDTLNASLQINDKNYAMQKNGTAYSVTANASIFGNFQPKINLKQNGITKTETIQEYTGLQSKYLLEIFGRFSGESSASSSYYKYRGDINIDIKNSELPVKVSIITDVNGKIIAEKSVGPSQVISVPVDEKINLKPGDKLTIYAKIQDKYGLNYKYVIIDYDAVDDKSFEIRNHPDIQGALEISDRNGNILYKQNYPGK